MYFSQCDFCYILKASATESGSGSGSADDCEGEEQEDSSSSHRSVLETSKTLDRLKLNDVVSYLYLFKKKIKH